MSMQEGGRLPMFFPLQLEVSGHKCFLEEETLNLAAPNGIPARWTIILGNNGTGKTSLLECIESLMPTLRQPQGEAGSFPPDPNKPIDSELTPLWLANHGPKPFPDSATMSFAEGRDLSSAIDKEFRWTVTSTAPFDYLYVLTFNDLRFFPWEHNLESYFSYWATRKMGKGVEFTENEYIPTHLRELINAEEWLAQLDYAILRGVPDIQKQWDIITQTLVEILPDVRAFRPATTKEFKHYIEVETDYGWVPLRQLSYGYQTMLAWIVDLAKRMIDAYPDSEEPLKESAVVLIDEIDLHLHPSWQRRIVGDLSRNFPNVQFIATSHSPLVVQSAERCNIAVLHKDGDRVHIRNYPDQSYQGWSVEEILRELMEMDSTHSEAFTQAMEAFEKAISTDDYNAAQAAYQTLDRILHPESVHRKLMRMQMGALERPAQV